MVAPSNKWLHRLSILKRITRKYFYRLLGGANKHLQPNRRFDIKKGYHHARSAETFDDTMNEDEWQKEVYELAAMKAGNCLYGSIIDVGCGSGYKLVKMLGHLDTTGIEINPTYDWLVKKYPEKKWLLSQEINPRDLYTDLVICSDVVEHVDNPDTLMNLLSQISFRHLVISTPDRDAAAGKNDYGPPENTSHFREWSTAEFKNYLEHYFIVEEQHIFRHKSVTQVVICKKKVEL